jgi:hypothetical protein
MIDVSKAVICRSRFKPDFASNPPLADTRRRSFFRFRLGDRRQYFLGNHPKPLVKKPVIP